MGIAKSLRKSGRLSSFAQGLSSVLNSLSQDDSLEQYLQQVDSVRSKIGKRFTSDPYADRTTEVDENEMSFDILGDIGANQTGDYAGANQKSLGDIADFVMKSLGSKVDQNVKSSALSGLDLFRQSMTPPQKKPGEIKAVNPEYDVYQDGKMIKAGDKKSGPKKEFKGISAKGYWEVDNSDPANPQLKWIENEDYKADPTGKDDSYADFSRLIGEVGEGIGKINLIKTAKQNEKSKLFQVPDPFGLGNYELTQEELNTLKEQVKTIYSDKAITLVTQQGLQPAVEDIRAILKKENNDINKAITKFKELNPDFTPDQIRILKDYFTLFLQ